MVRVSEKERRGISRSHITPPGRLRAGSDRVQNKVQKRKGHRLNDGLLMYMSLRINVVRRGGLEPPRCYSLAPQASASANSAISAGKTIFSAARWAPLA